LKRSEVAKTILEGFIFWEFESKFPEHSLEDVAEYFVEVLEDSEILPAINWEKEDDEH
jgi:hypothetical protein